MKNTITRRQFAKMGGGAAVLALAGCSTTPPNGTKPGAVLTSGANRQFALQYGARPEEQFPIPALKPAQLAPKFRRQRVSYSTAEPVGTVVVDTKNFFLYHVEAGGMAMRYGVGLGRAGFEWSGRGRIAWKRPWPKWTPPAEMIAREPELEKWSAQNGGMPPGLENPLGARALYIFQGKVDTLYRLHGSINASSIGKAVSSGCVRLVNQDVIDLFDRVQNGSRITVV